MNAKLAQLRADNAVLAKSAQTTIEKCEQYWNERSPCDAEFRTIMEFIHRWFSTDASGALERARGNKT